MSIPSGVVFLVSLQEKFEIDLLGSERVKLLNVKVKTSRTNWGQLTCTLFSDSKTDIPGYLRRGRHFVSRISVLAVVVCDHDARQEVVLRLSLKPRC